MRWSWIALCLAMACGGGDLYVEEAANTAMSAGDFGVAMDKASTGIESARASGDPAAVWRLEMIVLEAMARSGQGALIVAELLVCGLCETSQCKAVLELRSHAKAAGDTNGAIELWAAGDKKYPAESALFKREIETLQSAGTLDPAELEKVEDFGLHPIMDARLPIAVVGGFLGSGKTTLINACCQSQVIFELQ